MISREEQKFLFGHKNSQRWQLLRSLLLRYRPHQEAHKIAEAQLGDDIPAITTTNQVAS